MSNWSLDKLIFVTEKYFSCNNSVVAAQRAFRLHYNVKSKSAAPSRKTILRCVENVRKPGSVMTIKKRTPTVRTPENIQVVRENIEASSSKSIRRLSQEAEVSATSTYRILSGKIPETVIF